jgi:hypothetical protein
MKHIIVALAMISLLTTSCKKDRVCNCSTPANGSVAEQKFTYKLDDTKKKSAKNSCKIANEHWALSGGKCELAK